MKQLEIQVIDFVNDPHHAADEEEKISSSSVRKQLLGTLLRPPLKVSREKESIFIISQEPKFRIYTVLFNVISKQYIFMRKIDYRECYYAAVL